MSQVQVASAPPATAPQGFVPAFWFLNIIEMFERLAYYTLRVMAPIYIVQADNPGGLHLTPQERGWIYAWWAIFQSILPIVTGGFADRYGYKRTLTWSISVMTLGYAMVALVRDVPGISNYWALFTSIMIMASGTAFFKPSIQGSLAQNLSKANSSVGWSIFYWVVNVGAFIGHYIPGLVFLAYGTRSKEAWRLLFLLAAGFMALNFLILPLFKDSPSGAPKDENIFKVLGKTFTNILEPRLLCWMAIMSCFWLMMYQLWDLQPLFIADWIDSGPIVSALSFLPQNVLSAVTEQTPRGTQIAQQVLLSVNSFCIILGVVGVGWLTRRMRTLTAMLLGMLLATTGVLVAGLTMSPWMLLGGILFFSLGEMTTGPKKSEYLALIAPPGKKGLYLGYVNIPVGVGLFVGSWLAGEVYGRFGERAILALRFLVEKTPIGAGKIWNGEMESLEKLTGISRTDAFAKLLEVTGLTGPTATQILWDTYHPHLYVWIPFAVIGVVAAVGLAIFGQMAKRWQDMNA